MKINNRDSKIPKQPKFVDIPLWGGLAAASINAALMIYFHLPLIVIIWTALTAPAAGFYITESIIKIRRLRREIKELEHNLQRQLQLFDYTWRNLKKKYPERFAENKLPD